MENVLVASIVLFLIVFGVLTLSETFIATQDVLRGSWADLQTRAEIQASTHLLPLEAHTASMGTVVELTLRNDGSVPLADFDRWDVVFQYYDGGVPADYHIAPLSYVRYEVGGGEWTTAGIYGDVDQGASEVYSPGILDPGEEIVLHLRGTSPVGAGTTNQITVVTASGSRATILFTGNFIPVLATNAGLTLPVHGTAALSNSQLQATDDNDVPDDLLYTVVAGPVQGTLSPEDTFTQADIDAGRVTYSHAGTGEDSFQFTLSDGKDTLGPYVFSLAVSEPPVLVVNTSLTINLGDTVTIDSIQLQTSDPDDAAADLVYTVLHIPEEGHLSLGSQFTQADIDAGALIYTHTGVRSDGFQFVISDGETTIGPYNINFIIFP